MPVTTRSNWASQLLIAYITDIVRNLEPELHFLNFGKRRDIPAGYNKLTFPKVNQIGTADVGTITEGITPTSLTWGSSAVEATITQYGLVIQVSDLLVRGSAVEVINNCATEVRNALARKLDAVVQAKLITGSQVLYGGDATSRDTIDGSDTFSHTLIAKSVGKLRAKNARPVEGRYFVMIAHPDIVTDLTLETTTGSIISLAYTSASELRQGQIGEFRGARILQSANVQTVTNTGNVVVYPTYIFGEDAYGWGFAQLPTPIIVAQPDTANPLGLITSIGAKAALAVEIIDNNRLIRVESASAQNPPE